MASGNTSWWSLRRRALNGASEVLACTRSASQLSVIVQRAWSTSEKAHWRRRFLRHFTLTSSRRLIRLYANLGTSCRFAVRWIINFKAVRIVWICVKPVPTPLRKSSLSVWICFVRFGANISKSKRVWLCSVQATHEESYKIDVAFTIPELPSSLAAAYSALQTTKICLDSMKPKSVCEV